MCRRNEMQKTRRQDRDTYASGGDEVFEGGEVGFAGQAMPGKLGYIEGWWAVPTLRHCLKRTYTYRDHEAKHYRFAVRITFAGGDGEIYGGAS